MGFCQFSEKIYESQILLKLHLNFARIFWVLYQPHDTWFLRYTIFSGTKTWGLTVAKSLLSLYICCESGGSSTQCLKSNLIKVGNLIPLVKAWDPRSNWTAVAACSKDDKWTLKWWWTIVHIERVMQKAEFFLLNKQKFCEIGNGILLPKLFWPTVRKNCSSYKEKLLKFEAESREFENF